MNNNKNVWLGWVLMLGAVNATQAEVLVILPESGPMARAALSIKTGFMQAYQTSKSAIPLRFVNSDGQDIPVLLKRELNEQTQVVVGPLARGQVEALIQSAPTFKTLALNDVSLKHENVTQFSLAKHQDAKALVKVIQKDLIEDLIILRQAAKEKEYELFLTALLGLLNIQHEVVDHIPENLSSKQGILFLGDADWLKKLGSLPKQNVYTTSQSIAAPDDIAQGLKFCDTSAQYAIQGAQLNTALQEQPMPFQRLIAFGGDAWQITQHMVKQPHISNYQFKGQTGYIQMQANHIERLPQCFEQTSKKIKAIT